MSENQALINEILSKDDNSDKLEIKLDIEDKHFLDEFTWYIGTLGYVMKNSTEKNSIVYIHNCILPKKKGFLIDHINRNKLDNRRCNLRYVSKSQNSMNSKKRVNNVSGFRGVCWFKRDKKWRAYITINQKQHHLGYFEKIEDAVSAYKKAAIKYFGEYCGEL